jgi:hypothetical protein
MSPNTDGAGRILLPAQCQHGLTRHICHQGGRLLAAMNDQSYIQARADRVARLSKQGREVSRLEPVHGTIVAARTNPLEQLIGQRYRLGTRLGRGRLGEIHEARDESSHASETDRRLAIQLIDEQLAARPHFAEEFKRGATELQAISHPNIVQWLDAGRDGGRYFVVMELPEGASLRDVLDTVMALTIEETAAIVRAAGDALRHLHAKGFMHGNLKPENVLVTFDYKVKLQDVAPQDWLPQSPDIRDDVYALACLTYEMLLGRHPFNANTPAEALRAGLEPIRIDGLTPRRWQALARGLALHREQRTPTVAEFLHEFGITGTERLRKTVSGVAATRRAPVLPEPRPEPEPGAAYGYSTRPPARSGAGLGRFLAIVAVVVLAALTFANRDRVRDWVAELMVATNAMVQGGADSQGGEKSSAPVPDRPAVATAEPSDAVVPAPVPPIDQAPAQAPPAVAAAVKPVASGSRFGFAQSRVTVSEDEVAARIVIQRSGDTTRAATVAWWTIQDTARAGKDYADLGRRVEQFAPGEQSRVIYVPLVNDAAKEGTKSFNVYLGRNAAGRDTAEPIAGVRIDIVDDD